MHGVITMETSGCKEPDSIPKELDGLLTEEQIETLHNIEQLGLALVDIRKPLFQAPILIVKLLADGRYGVLLKDGSVHFLEVLADQSFGFNNHAFKLEPIL